MEDATQNLLWHRYCRLSYRHVQSYRVDRQRDANQAVGSEVAVVISGRFVWKLWPWASEQ